MTEKKGKLSGGEKRKTTEENDQEEEEEEQGDEEEDCFLFLCFVFLWSPLRRIGRVQLTCCRRETCFVLLCLFVL